MADEGIESADRRNLACHRRIADRENQQDDGREQECRGRADAVTEADGDRRVEQHRSNRR
jgi:hypothetical protein